MIFVSFEDEQSIFETVLFPDAFERFYPLLDDGWAFLIFGRVEDDLGALAISVERLVTISRRTGEAVGMGANAGEETAAAAPERPPVFMWGRVPTAVPHGLEPAAVPRALGIAAAT
jgi:DNA polymerase III alpha subunit